MEFFNLIVRLIEVLRDFLILWSPIKYTVVQEGHLGVRFTFGKPGHSLGAGIHFATSGQYFESISARRIKSEVNQCENFTKDRIPVKVYGNYTYDIKDAAKYLTNSQDSDWLLVEIVEQEIFSWFASKSFEECHEKVISGEITEELRLTINEKCVDFGLGIEVAFVRISDWQVSDQALLRCLALEPMLEILNQYEGPAASLVGLVAGNQPIINCGV